MRRAALELRPWQQHSNVLTVAGFVYITYGLIAVGTDWDPSRAGTLILVTHTPALLWMFAWLGVGMLALISTRWPASSKTWGYTALAGLATWWSVVYATSTLLGADPARNVGGTLVWALVAYLWYAISGLVNPDDITNGG